MKNYYEILEVNPTASNDIIRKIFKIQIKKNHPDLFSGEEQKIAEEKTKEINEAYEILSDSQKREEYDKALEIESKNNLYNNDSIVYEDTNLIETIRRENLNLKQELEKKNNVLDKLLHLINENDYLHLLQAIEPETYNNKVNNEQEYIKKESYSRHILNVFKELIFKIILLILFTLLVLIFSIFILKIDFSKIIDIFLK